MSCWWKPCDSERDEGHRDEQPKSSSASLASQSQEPSIASTTVSSGSQSQNRYWRHESSTRNSDDDDRKAGEDEDDDWRDDDRFTFRRQSTSTSDAVHPLPTPSISSTSANQLQSSLVIGPPAPVAQSTFIPPAAAASTSRQPVVITTVIRVTAVATSSRLDATSSYLPPAPPEVRPPRDQVTSESATPPKSSSLSGASSSTTMSEPSKQLISELSNVSSSDDPQPSSTTSSSLRGPDISAAATYRTLKSSNRTVAIAVPIVISLLLLVGVVGWLLLRRRRSRSCKDGENPWYAGERKDLTASAQSDRTIIDESPYRNKTGVDASSSVFGPAAPMIDTRSYDKMYDADQYTVEPPKTLYHDAQSSVFAPPTRGGWDDSTTASEQEPTAVRVPTRQQVRFEPSNPALSTVNGSTIYRGSVVSSHDQQAKSRPDTGVPALPEGWSTAL